MRIKASEEALMGMTYGVELETEGISRKNAAEAVQSVVGGTVTYHGHGYDTWRVIADDGRKWDCSYDGSLAGGGAEVVTPVLTISDMGTLQKVVRALRAEGARVSSNCGSHVHVGAKDMTADQVKRLVELFYKNEELLMDMCRVRYDRRSHYAAYLDKTCIEKIAKKKNIDFDFLNRNWLWCEGHGNYIACRRHYGNARYRALNLCNLWDDDHGSAKKTVEFRLFEGTLHAGMVKANVLLALLLVLKAKNAKAGSIKNRWNGDKQNEKFFARVFLQNIGMVGDFTKNTRKHLMDHLKGSSREIKKNDNVVAA